MSDEVTIGRIDWGGRTYEVDWPFEVTNPSERSDFAAIYLDGEMLARGTCPPGETWGSAQAIMDSVQKFVEAGGLEDA